MRVLDRLIAAGEDHQPAPQRALRVPSLRPYLPGRAHVRRTVGGLRVLARMGWKAVRAGLRKATAPPKTKKPQPKGAAKDEEKKDGQPGFLDTLERAGAATLIVIVVLAAGAGVVSTLWAQIAPYTRTAVGVAVAVLLAAAWAVGPKPQAESAGESEQPAAEGDTQSDPAPLPHTAEPLDGWAVVRAVRQIATANGWRGAHLDDVLAHLPGRSREELLAVLAEAGIPIADQLKLTLPGGRQRNRQGIRVSALPPTPAEAPTQAAPEPPPAGPAEEVPDHTPPRPPLVVYGTE